MSRCYSVRPTAGSDWHVLVVAPTARVAKRIGYATLREVEWLCYTEVRVRWLKGVVVLPEFPPGTAIAFSQCTRDKWMCEGWTTDGIPCLCDHYAAKAKEQAQCE